MAIVDKNILDNSIRLFSSLNVVVTFLFIFLFFIHNSGQRVKVEGIATLQCVNSI